MRPHALALAVAIAGAVLAAPASVSASTAPGAPLTLSDAVHYALAHDPTVQQNAAAVAQAIEALAKQKMQTFPTVSGQLQNTLSKSNPTYSGSFAQIGITPQTNFSQNTAQVSSQLNVNAGGLSVIQLAESKAQLDQAKATLQRSQDRLASTVTAAFYGISQKNAIVAIDQSDLSYQRILALNAQAKERAGVAAGVDVLRAQVAAEKSASTLTADQAAVEDAKESLAHAIGAPLETLFAIPASVPQPALPQGSVETLISIAQNARPDIRSAQLALRNAQLVRKGFDRELFPNVQLSGAFGNQFSPTGAVYDQSIIDSDFAQNNAALIAQNLPPLPASDKPTVTRGAPGFWNIQATTTFTLPFVDYGARKAERNQDDAALTSANAALDNAKSQAELDVRQSYRAAQTALAQLKYAQDESRLGVEAARIAQLQYQNGIIALSDVSQAEQTSIAAQSDLINARVAYVEAVVNLRVALGTFDPQSIVADLR